MPSIFASGPRPVVKCLKLTTISVISGVFEVKATAGDTHLGGEDFDQRLMDHLIAMFDKKHPGLGDAVRKSNRSLQRLRRQCEVAKRALSSQTSTAVEVMTTTLMHTHPISSFVF